MATNPNTLGNRLARQEMQRTNDSCLCGYQKHKIISTRNMLYGDCYTCTQCKKFWNKSGKRLDDSPGPSLAVQQRNIRQIEETLGIQDKGLPPETK